MNRKPVFDLVRRLLGRGFKQSEVTALDKALDEAFSDLSAVAVTGGDPEWVTLAAPLIERFEGMERKIPGGKVAAYPDPGTGGKPWTIGIGSTTDESGNPIAPSAVWTEDRARKRFKAHLAEFGREVDALLNGAPTTAAQKAALVSLAYNIGAPALSRSTALRLHLTGNYAGAADAFLLWNKAGGRVLKGLVRRREAERDLYNS